MLIGVDIGTSSVKAGAYGDDGRFLAVGRSRPYTFDSPHEGWSQADPSQWSDRMCEALRDLYRVDGIRSRRVRAVGLSVLFPALAPLDRDGNALYPAILYNDLRSGASVDIIRSSLDPGVYERIIGNLVVPGTCAATSLVWLREHEPVIFQKCDCLGFANTSVLARLTGQSVTDTTNSALSGLVDMRRPHLWSDQLLDALGLDSSALPRIVRPWEVVGEVEGRAAEETGIPKGTPVVCGCGDSISGSFGAGVIDPQTVAYQTV